MTEPSTGRCVQFLADLLAVEVAATEQRRLEGRVRFAKVPAHKTLEQFDFDAQPSLDRRLVDDGLLPCGVDTSGGRFL